MSEYLVTQNYNAICPQVFLVKAKNSRDAIDKVLNKNIGFKDRSSLKARSIESIHNEHGGVIKI